MKHHLEEEIPQFFGHLLVVTGVHGIQQFIDFFHGMITERAVGLFPIPRATGGRSESRHHAQEFLDGWFGFGFGFGLGGTTFHRITRSSRCTTSERVSLPAAISVAEKRVMPRANSCPFRSQTRTTSPALNWPSQSRTPGGK